MLAAAQDDQLPAVYVYPSEYIENGSRAIRGIVKGPKQIGALFHLPSTCDSLTEDAQVALCMLCPSRLYVMQGSTPLGDEVVAQLVTLL